MADLKTALQKRGQRLTVQREAVFQALCGTKSHPTAEELYLTIREQTPDISLATVYNTLETLVSCGLVVRLVGERSARYDAGCQPHAHARCLDCGAIQDLPPSDPLAWPHEGLPEGFTPHAVMVEVSGICASCQASDDATSDGHATAGRAAGMVTEESEHNNGN